MTSLDHPEMIVAQGFDRDAAEHAIDIFDRMGAPAAIAELAELAYAVRHTGGTYRYVCDVAETVGTLGGWDGAESYFHDCYAQASEKNGHRR